VIYKCELLLREHPKRHLKETLIMTQFPKEVFPIQISDFEGILKERQLRIQIALQKKWRQFLLDELKDNLIQFYNVYEVNFNYIF